MSKISRQLQTNFQTAAQAALWHMFRSVNLTYQDSYSNFKNQGLDLGPYSTMALSRTLPWMLREGELLLKQCLERGGKAPKSSWATCLGEPAAFGCALTSPKSVNAKPKQCRCPHSYPLLSTQVNHRALKLPENHQKPLLCWGVKLPVTHLSSNWRETTHWDLRVKHYQQKERLKHVN